MSQSKRMSSSLMSTQSVYFFNTSDSACLFKAFFTGIADIISHLSFSQCILVLHKTKENPQKRNHSALILTNNLTLLG